MTKYKKYNLKDILRESATANYAVGHFNFSELTTLKAIVGACRKYKAPVFIGTSEGESDFVGYEQAVALRDALRKTLDVPVFLNADHHRSYERCKQAIDAEYDSVHFDGTDYPFEENMSIAKKVVEYARHVNPDISIEGEVGYIRGSSSVFREVIEIRPQDMTSPEQARTFVDNTGVDRFAVVIGNIHGISIKGNPHLDIERLKNIRRVIPQTPLTLHGGSGIGAEDISRVLPFGISNIHVNTELRVAFTDALRTALRKDADQSTPYKYLTYCVKSVQKVVEEKLELFGYAWMGEDKT